MQKLSTKNCQLLTKLKTIVLSVAIGITLAATVTFAACITNVWNPTDEWILDGAVISAQKVAENFEYLKSKLDNNTVNISNVNTEVTNLDFGIRGYQVVSNTVTFTGHQSVNISCPLGKKVLGGGCYQGIGSFSGSGVSRTSNRAIVENNPFPSGDGWHCYTRDIAVGEVAGVTAYAICADISN